MTSQRLYAILRRAGIKSAKRYSRSSSRPSDNWSPGVYIKRDSDAHVIWFDVSYKVYGSGEEHKRRVMKDRIIPALQAAGIQGTVSADGLTFRVEE